MVARTVSPLALFHLREAFLQSGVFGPRGTRTSRSRRSFETGSCQAEQGKNSGSVPLALDLVDIV